MTNMNVLIFGLAQSGVPMVCVLCALRALLWNGSYSKLRPAESPSGAEIDHVRFTHGVFFLGGFFDEGDEQLEIVGSTNRSRVR